MHELQVVLSSLEHTPEIIVITEVKNKTNNNAPISEFTITGYELFSTNEEETSRGIFVYVDVNLKASINILNSKFKEHLIISIKGDKIDDLTICAIYRSPNSKTENDSLLSPFINQVCNEFKGKTIFIGDFNVNDINWRNYTSTSNSSSSLNLIKAIRDNFLTQHIDSPTRARGADTPHILDLVLTNNSFINEINYLAPLGQSDHVCLEIICNFESEKVIQNSRFNYSKGDYDNLRNFLNADWLVILNPQSNNCETMWQIFKDKVIEGEKLYIPQVKNFNPKNKNWKRPLSVEIRDIIKGKKRIFNTYLKTRNPAILLKYKRISNIVRSQTRNLFKKDQVNIAQQCKSNPKKFWNYVNSKLKNMNKIGKLNFKNSMGMEETTTEDNMKSEIMNNFFKSVFVEEDNREFTQMNIMPNLPNMESIKVKEEDILKRLLKLNINKSPGPDKLHPRILYEVRNEIVSALVIIFNQSLIDHHVPQDWRAGNVSPVFKKGSKTDPANYRPISLTSIVCKIFESIIRDHIVDYFEDNNLYSVKQYGFIKGRSTVLQLLRILDDWTEMLEGGGQIDVIYTDFEKAFDRVPHKRLISKLYSYNINEDIIKWIKAYLENRIQRVKIQNSYSKWGNVISGIPQGTILGPLLFIIYINELSNICDSGSCLFLYADDAKIYNHILDKQDKEIIQNDLNKLKLWADNWLIKLNIDKCKKVSYGRVIDSNYQYSIENKLLENLDSIKDLGVTFDTHLKFGLHINEKINKAYSILGVIKRNFSLLDKDSFLVIYKSMVRSHLEYANCIWAPYTVQDKKNLEKVQMRATKIIKEIKHLGYIARLTYLKLPTLLYRRLRGDMIMVFKLLTGRYDANIACKFNKTSSFVTRGHHLRLTKSHHHYDLRKYYFSNRIISNWNSLPDSVIGSNTVAIFERKLDIFWCNQDCIYNYKSDLEGTGSRSQL